MRDYRKEVKELEERKKQLKEGGEQCRAIEYTIKKYQKLGKIIPPKKTTKINVNKLSLEDKIKHYEEKLKSPQKFNNKTKKKIKRLLDRYKKVLEHKNKKETIEQKMCSYASTNRRRLSRQVRWVECCLRLLGVEYLLEEPILRKDNSNSFYILDVYLPNENVCFEIDDPSHDGREKQDEYRDKHNLQHYQIKTYRFTHEEINADIKGILKKINKILK